MNIAQKESVTQLTLKGVYSLLDEGKKDVIVQVLEPEAIVNQKSDNKSLKFKVFISDGYTKHKAVLGNEASLAFEGAGQPGYCVIRVLELMQQNAQPQKRLVIITKIELINPEVDELIGAPIEYQEWLASNKQNRGGSNQIPPRFLSNFRSQNQANNNMNNNFGNTPAQNNANSFNRQQPQPAANQQNTFNQNQRAPAPATGLNNNFNSNQQQQQPSRNSMGGGNNFNNNNNNNNNNNQRNMNPSNNNSNKFNNQNENIPPSGGNNFKGQQQEQKRGPVSYINHNNQFNVPEEEFLALNVLAPYAPFVIKVRVTSKSDLRTFAKNGVMGEGHVFSADLIDKEGNEITASFFGEAALKFSPILEENAVYIMRNGNVKMVNSKFNRKSNNDYQIVFDKADSFIQKVEEDSGIMLNKFNFVKLSTIEELPGGNDPIDIAAYIKDVGPVTEVMLKKGNDAKKERRVIYLYDNSNTLVEMTLWGEICNNQDLQPDTLVLIKAARVSVFNNAKSLSSSFTTKIIARQDLIPDVPEINQLREWKNSEFDSAALNSKVREAGSGGKKYDPFTIEEINKLTENKTIDTAFFDLYAYVSHIKTESPNLYYAACPTEKCKRKAIDNDGIFNCPHCVRNFSDPLYRYTLSIKLSDHTGSIWVSAFDAVAQAIIGHEAKAIKEMKDQQNDTRIAEIFKDAHHREFEFKLIAKMDHYNGNDRLKFQAIRVEKINYVKHGNALLAELDKYSQKN